MNILLWAFFVVTSTVFCAIALVLRIVTALFDPNRRILQQFSCFWASLYLWCNPFWSVGAMEGVDAVDRRKAYVMVANHQSMADILVLFRTFLHFKWVSKKSMFRVPLLGWNMILNGYIPIERGDEASREACMRLARKWLAVGSSVLFFPEGTRSRDGRLQPFKTGAFRLALETGHEILPIVIQGTLHAIPKHSKLLHRKSRMSIRVLAPIASRPFDMGQLDQDAKALARKTEEVFAEAVDISFRAVRNHHA